jgi:hypothetical protein
VSGNDRYRSLHPADRLSVVLEIAEIDGPETYEWDEGIAP